MEKNSILLKNEVEANKFAAAVMIFTNIFAAIVYILNALRIFTASQSLMTVAMVLAAVLLTIPFIIVRVLKISEPWVKYVTVTAAILMVGILSALLSYHTVVMYAFPFAIASLFFSRKLSWYTTVVSIIVISVSQLLTIPLDGVPDANLTDIYSTVVYGIAPRTIQLIILSVIFIVLSKRTHKLLSNMMGAEEQQEMLDKMLKVTRKSNDVSSVLAQSVGNLSLMTENTTKANESIANKTSKIAEGSKQSIKNMEEATAAVTNMSESLNKIADEGKKLGELSEQVHTLTSDSEQVMKTAVEEMNAIAEATKQSKETIARLEQRSGDISKFVQVITEISAQTNMLALNASIESARAGEQGKGFAVVAQEIRNLAEGSQKAAKDIAALIKEITEDTQNAVSAMDTGSELVDRGLSIFEDARNSFNRVAEANKEMNEKLAIVNNDTNKAAGHSDKVVAIVREVKDINTGTLQDLEQIAMASEELVASMEELDSSVENIETMSKELVEVVN
ncbi:MAG: methyl-accepting chemotaxis sensory transducer [Eubacterium sp.]|jgi:methyl-accepting chemotaxis protein|nr:methyl-accepting chemotaxis sensory transducer [Eubacterium sp.]